MLHVQRADHVNARLQQLQNVLIAFFISAKGGVGVRQLIDDGDLRPSLEDCVEVHFLHRHAPVLHPLAWNHFESLDQRLCFGPTMCLDKRQDNIDAALFKSMGLLQHLIGLADTGGRADVNLQPPALGALYQLQKIFGSFAFRGHQKTACIWKFTCTNR